MKNFENLNNSEMSNVKGGGLFLWDPLQDPQGVPDPVNN
ncbi:MAG: bacteriocin [bacterium]|nr:bacteriocin [bacterium]